MPDTSQIKGAVQRALVTRRLWVTVPKGVFVWQDGATDCRLFVSAAESGRRSPIVS